MKFILLDKKVIGHKAKIKIKGSPQPVEIYYDIDNYTSFDAAVKATYKDSFQGYVVQPQQQYG